jgi:oligopeptide transport system permease protein
MVIFTIKGGDSINIIYSLFKTLFIYASIALIILLIVLIPVGTETKVENYDQVYHYNWSVYWVEAKETINQLLRGNGLGITKFGVSVFQHTHTYVIRSLWIILPGFILSVLLGLLKGLIDYRIERVSSSVFGRLWNTLFTSLPDFFIFILIQYSFMILARKGFPSLDLYGYEHWYNTILPILSLVTFPVFYLSKIVQVDLKNEENQEYILTAKAKGVSSFWIVLQHMLKNCLQTIMSHFQTLFIFILSSLPIIELLSAYNGAGYQLLMGIQSGEYKLVIGYLYIFLFIMIIAIWFSKLVLYFSKKNFHYPRFRQKKNINGRESSTRNEVSY